MKSWKICAFALCVVVVLGAGCHRVSPEEKTFTQKMFNFGIDVSSKDLAEVKKPSKFFPFVMGLALLSEEKYDLAHQQFAKLAKEYPDSKVAAYYMALSGLGIKHKVALPQLVHDFYEQLYGAKDTTYFYEKSDEGWRAYDTRDPMFAKFEDEVLLKETRVDISGLNQGVEKWFGSLKRKRPYDYIIYSMFSANGEEATRSLREGLERYPDSRPLMELFVKKAFRTEDKEMREEAGPLLDKLASDPLFALLKVAVTCEDNPAEWTEQWGLSLHSPLCREQVGLMESIRWDKVSGSVSAEDEIKNYYREYVAPKVQSQFDASRWIGMATPSATLALLDLSGRIFASAFEAYTKKDYGRAAHYLSWNKDIYRVLGKKGNRTMLSKMVQLMIAKGIFKGMGEINAAEGNEAAAKEYAGEYERLEQLEDFYTDYVKGGPYFHTAGLPRLHAYEVFEAQRPIWVDRVFAEHK